jgi:hypothetical protein
MRNLEHSVGVHRVVKGVGRSNPGELAGTFLIPLGTSPHCRARWAVCEATPFHLKVHVKYPLAQGKIHKRRPPFPDELKKLRDLFFEDHESPIQYHPKQTKDQYLITLYANP